ncbi:MAG TPA: cupin domain-containing protein [Xanthobacteraceae bacterium]|jgi:mannose-6-phosphate isomerase-like protein (cupin superfamily)
MRKQVRRVVTGHDAAGRSTFIIDGPTPHVFSRTPSSAIVYELWQTTRTPADNRGSHDAIARGHRLLPPANGSVFRVIEYPPDAERIAAIARERLLPDDGSGRAAATDRNNPRHPGFHKTNTIDYAIVLAGEIFAMMDDGEVLLKAGDVLIQRGTNHAWSNRSNEPAVVAFVLIDAEP